MKERNFKNVLLSFTSVFMIIFCITPFVFMLLISFSKNPDFLSEQTTFMFTLENIKNILTIKNLHFIDYLKNSLIISFISSVITILIASTGAYAITRLKISGRILILLTILAVSMFPQISIVGYIFKFMSTIGWINTYQALIFPYISWSLPLALWILVSYFSQIPKELDKAGLIDGCSKWQILYKIILPVSLPGIFSTIILVFIFSFNEFLFALMLTTNFHSQTIPVGITLFQGIHGEIPWGNIMAASMFSTLPIVVLIFIFQKYIIQGLTKGAVKG